MTINESESDDSAPGDLEWLYSFAIRARCPRCTLPYAARDRAACDELARGHALTCAGRPNEEDHP